MVESQRMRRVACVLLALFPTISFADPGDHLKAGDAIITPKVTLGLEHSTNANRRPGDEGATPGTALRLAPGVEATTDSTDLKLKFNAEYELRKFFQADAVEQNLDRFDEYQLGLGLNALPNSIVGFGLSDSLSHRYGFDWISDGASETPLSGRGGMGSRIANTMSASVKIRPTSTLEVSPTFNWNWVNYDVATGDPNNEKTIQNAYGGQLASRLQFFPRTAFLFDARYDFTDWRDNAIDNGEGLPLAVPDSATYKIAAGMRGNITTRLSTSVIIGYGGLAPAPGTIGNNPDLDVGIAGARHLVTDLGIKYETSNKSGVSLGYKRNFSPTFFTNFVAQDAFTLGVNAVMTPKLALKTEALARLEDYSGAVTRSDLFVGLKGDLGYKFTEWASMSGGAAWSHRDSLDGQVAGQPVVEVTDVQYDDVNIHVFTTIIY